MAQPVGHKGGVQVGVDLRTGELGKDAARRAAERERASADGERRA